MELKAAKTPSQINMFSSGTDRRDRKRRLQELLEQRDPDIIEQAKERIEARLCGNQFGFSDRFKKFLDNNRMFSSLYVINGITKRDFAIRLMNHRVQFKSQLRPNYDILKRLNEITKTFHVASPKVRKQYMEELCSMYALDGLLPFLEKHWESCCFKVTEMLNECFESNDTVLVEVTAITSALMAVRFPIGIFRHSEIASMILKKMIKAFSECYLAIKDFTKDLQIARFIYLDDKIRGKETRFSYPKFKSEVNTANHRLGSIIYYSISMILYKANSAELLYRVAAHSINTRNPVQYFLLHLLANSLIYLEYDSATTSEEHFRNLKSIALLLKRYEESENYESVSVTCQILVARCIKLSSRSRRPKFNMLPTNETMASQKVIYDDQSGNTTPVTDHSLPSIRGSPTDSFSYGSNPIIKRVDAFST